MLQVQNYLLSGKSLADLTNEFGIVCKVHDNLPYVILNYDQIESKPKTHQIVRECRALILNTTDWSLVGRSFSRFFNWGEVADEMGDFDFSNFMVESKEDGSLVVIYWSEQLQSWLANTRGSFASDKMQFQNITWTEGFLLAIGATSLKDLEGILDKSLTYVCEFCSPWNKVVRRYEQPKMYLLTIFQGENELTWEETDKLALGLLRGDNKPGFC